MKSDLQVQKDVMDQLKYEPFLNASEIGVAVKNGVVTLSGQVDSYAKKLAAENATKKISGVKAIAEDIQIDVSPSYNKTDSEIAETVVNALRGHAAVQDEKIKIKVENGCVELEGEVDWQYQRWDAKAAVENLAGVRSVTNLITVKPRKIPSDIEQKLTAALQRSASIDARHITVDVKGDTVTLRGNVHSFAQKTDAERIAWNAPGVHRVLSNLEIDNGRQPLAD